jgi:hypothetical protein
VPCFCAVIGWGIVQVAFDYGNLNFIEIIMRNSGPGKKSKNLFWAALILFLVGMHSILLGLGIYFFTDIFYKVFFAASIENIFFVRQSGIFLFLQGLFYLYPLFNLKNLYNLTLVVIIAKIVAVYFLIANAQYTAAPEMIYLAAFFDALMGAGLTVVYVKFRRAYSQPHPGIRPTAEASVKEIA